MFVIGGVLCVMGSGGTCLIYYILFIIQILILLLLERDSKECGSSVQCVHV